MPEQHIDNEKIPTRLIVAIVAVDSLAFTGILTETAMTVLFPTPMRELHVGTVIVQWVTTIHLSAVTATIPISPFLKRRFTLKTIFLTAVILAIAGSLIMVVAQAFPLPIIARIVQGIGSGVATPLMINIIPEQPPRSKTDQLIGVGSLVITVAPAIGPTAGDTVTTALPRCAIPVIVIPSVLITACIDMKRTEQKTPIETAYLGPIRLRSIVVALVGPMLTLNRGSVVISATMPGKLATRPGITAVVSLAAGLILLIMFVMSSKRALSPLLRLGILEDPTVLLHACAYLLLSLVAVGHNYAIINVAQFSLGTTVFVTSSLVLPGALIGAVYASLDGQSYDKFGAVKPVPIPIGIAILDPVLMLVFPMQLTSSSFAGFYFILGLLYPIGNANVMTSGLSEVSLEFKPDGNATLNTCPQPSGAINTALLSTILSVA